MPFCLFLIHCYCLYLMSMIANIFHLFKPLFYTMVFILNVNSCSDKNIISESNSSGTRKHYIEKNSKAWDDRPKNSSQELKPDSLQEINVCVVGDLMCHKQQITNAKKGDKYDFSEYYEFVKGYISQADYAIGNLELTCAGKERGFSGYPSFNAPDEYVDALKGAGFDFLVTSNNHSMDLGEKGLLRTIEQIKRNQLGYTGTFETKRDHDSIRVVKIKGVNFAVLNYTYGTNGSYPDKGHEYMLNVIDSAVITKEIFEAKKLNPDFIMVFFHFGAEYNPDPNDAQKNAVRWAHNAGANLIIGGHPHVVGPCEWLLPTKSNPDTGFVAWTMGNYVSNMTKRFTDAGVMITLKLKKNNNTNKKSVSAEFVPTWVYKGENPSKKSHVIFPSEFATDKKKLPSYVDAGMIGKMLQAHEDTKSVINKNKANIPLKSLK